MKKRFEKFQGKLQRWMYGRYGIDKLSKSLFILSLVFLFLSGRSPIYNLLSLITLALVMIRTYSKDIEKRRRELSLYFDLTRGIRKFWALSKKKFRDRKTHKYYKCPNCKKDFRVPRGKGKIKIFCPNCGHEIIKRT